MKEMSSLTKHQLIAVGVVTILLVVGGVVLFGGGGDDPTDTPQPFPDTLTSATLSESHTNALLSAGTFTTSRHLTFTTNTSTQTMSTTMRIDLTDHRYFQNTTGLASGPKVTYTNATATYRLTERGGEDSYRKVTPPYDSAGISPVNRTTAMRSDVLATGPDLSFTRVNITTLNGVKVGKYTLTENSKAVLADHISTQRLDSTSDYSVEHVSLTLYVDANQTIRYAEFTFTVTTPNGATYTVDQTQRWTDIGDTTVPKPEWVTAAEQVSDSTSSGVDRQTCNYSTVDVSTDIRTTADGDAKLVVELDTLGNADSIRVKSPSGEVIGTMNTAGTTKAFTVTGYDYVTVVAHNPVCLDEPIKYAFPDDSG